MNSVITNVSDTDRLAGDIDRVADAGVAGSVTLRAARVIAWCAGCRENTDFVVPVGLADVADDELACLQCGWAVLVSQPVQHDAAEGAAA